MASALRGQYEPIARPSGQLVSGGSMLTNHGHKLRGTSWNNLDREMLNVHHPFAKNANYNRAQ